MCNCLHNSARQVFVKQTLTRSKALSLAAVRSTILRKHENYRQAFDKFDSAKISVYDEAKIEERLQNPRWGIVRRSTGLSIVVEPNECLWIEVNFGEI